MKEVLQLRWVIENFANIFNAEFSKAPREVLRAAADPQDAVFEVHGAGNSMQQVLRDAEHHGGAVDGIDRSDGCHDQAAFAVVVLRQFHGSSSAMRCAG